MDIGKLFLSLGIKADTKGLEDTIAKIEELKKKSKELNKELGAVKQNIGSSKGSALSSNPQVVSAQIEARLAKERYNYAKAEYDLEKLEQKKEKDKKNEKEKEEKKAEKEQKQREKDRERATKNFFKQIDNGFSFVAKAFTGSIIGSGVAGFLTAEAAKSTSFANVFQQYNIDPEEGQRWANVFRRANPAQVSKQSAMEMIAGVANFIASGQLGNPEFVGALSSIGLDTSVRNPLDIFNALRGNASKFDRATFSNLVSRLGIPPAYSQALNPENFSEQLFQESYGGEVLSPNQLKASVEISRAASDLANSFDLLKGKMLEEFFPEIMSIASKIKNLLTPENVKEGIKTAKNMATTYGAYWAITNPGKALALGAGYGITKQLNFLEEKGVKRIDGKIVSKEEFDAYKNKLSNPSLINYKTSSSKSGDYRLSDSLDQWGNFKDPKELRQFQNVIGDTYININTNIKTDSIDKTSLDSISNTIGDKVSNATSINSKYLTLAYPA